MDLEEQKQEQEELKQDDSRCLKCNINERKLRANEKKIINTQEEAAEITDWLYETVEIGEFVFRVGTVGCFLCLKCSSKLRLYKTNKKPKLEEQPQFSQSLNDAVSALTEIFSQTTSESQSSQSSLDPPVQFEPEREKPETVEMPINRTVATHKYCCLCGCTANNLVTISFHARSQAYCKTQIFIPKGNRTCKSHLSVKKLFYEDELRHLRIHFNSSVIEVSELKKLLENFSARVDRDIFYRVSDFSMPEKSLIVFTGLNWEQLIQLRGMLTGMRASHNRDVTQALVVFLLKLRSGNSNSMIAAILGIQWSQQISNFVESVIQSFKVDVLPSRFGINSLTRQELVTNHITSIAKKLHDLNDNQLMIIGDGTYLRHQKSANNDYQRKSYTGQKKCHLAKPFTICMPDGHVIDVLGPFEAHMNDAQILKHLLETNQEFSDLLQENDVFVLDRGFRDVVQYLQDKGYKVLMPSLKGKRNQLTREEANHSRFVTKIRWSVEAIHGVIGQKYKLLHHQFDNKSLHNAKHFVRIACFLNNFFGKRFHSDVGMTDEIVDRMKLQSQIENTLHQEAENGGWSRKKVTFSDLTSTDLSDFPEMTEKDLKIFFTGGYQLKQAVSYLAEMLDINGVLHLKYLKESEKIIRIQVQSRHIKSKTYNCYIEYSPETVGCAGIKRWCCECANGLRTIGCCSHVAAVIYYLSCGRFKSKQLSPSQILSELFVEDDTMPIIDEDSDDDD